MSKVAAKSAADVKAPRAPATSHARKPVKAGVAAKPGAARASTPLEARAAKGPVAIDGHQGARRTAHSAGFSLGNSPGKVSHKESGKVVVDQALADVYLALTKDPRVTYDLKGGTFLAMMNEAVGGGVAESDLWTLQSDFGVPKTTEIRKQVVKGICEKMQALHQERGIETAIEMVEVLKNEFGIDLKNRNTVKSFRRWFPDLVPRFLEGKKDRYADELETLKNAILASPDKPYADVARELGLTPARGSMLMLEIRTRWPDALPEARQRELWTDAELKTVQQALDDAPLGATLPELVAVLRTEAPEMLERHPLENSGVLAQALKRSFGIADWSAYKEQRYARAFAELAARSPPETTLTELVDQLREENPRAYSYVSVCHRFLDKWADHPKDFPEIAALRDENGEFPWNRARVKLTPELAAAVGAVIAEHPGKPLQDYVALLQKDQAFTRKYPAFDKATVQQLRGLYPDVVPYVTALQVRGRDARLDAWKAETKALAKKIAAVADGVDHPEGLTLAWLARQVGEPREKVGKAIRAHAGQFPWFQAYQTPMRLDLELAMRVAVEMSQAPMGTSRAQLLEKLNADETVKAEYPALKDTVFDQLRRRYPELIPDWRVRDQVLRTKMLRDAVLHAPKGTPFAEVVREVADAHPESFVGAWRQPRWIERLWKDNPERFPFLDALGKGKSLDLSGRGAPPKAEAETDLALANRLSRLEQLPDRLPVIDEIVRRSNKQTFRGFDFLCVQHLLGAQAAMFDGLEKMGMSKARTTIIGVPYSSSADVTDTMADDGWDVRRPPLDIEATEDAVREGLRERIAASLESGNKCIVIDDGGMVAQLLASDPELKEHAGLFRIVEQTRRGITVADSVELRAPVVNVAQSPGKNVEGPMVGDSLQVKAMDRLRSVGVDSIKGKKIGVIGAGVIGLPWAEYLRAHGAEVTVMDLGEAAREKARAHGFKVVEDRKAFFSKQDIIFGGTGMQSVTAEDLQYLKDGCILGSGSSKLVEIDVKALDRQSKPKVIDDEHAPPTVEYRLDGNRTVKLLARGFPLNFDGSSEIVANEKIQLTMALLMMGAVQASSSNVASVLKLDPKLQLEVLEYFAREEAASEKEIAAAVAEAQASLLEMLPKKPERPAR